LILTWKKPKHTHKHTMNSSTQHTKTSLKKMKKDELIEMVLNYQKIDAELEFQRKVSFWRMCEGHNGFHKNTNIHDDEWLEEMRVMISDLACGETAPWDHEELFEGYKDWIGYEEYLKEMEEQDEEDE
jgi:hypothetical protein